MNNIYLIPLQNVPQQFTISLAGVQYIVTCAWNDAVDAGWTLSFANATTGVGIVSNIPLVCGVDLLSGLEYLGFNGQLIAYTDGNPYAVPTLDNLGVSSNVYFSTSLPNG